MNESRRFFRKPADSESRIILDDPHDLRVARFDIYWLHVEEGERPLRFMNG